MEDVIIQRVMHIINVYNLNPTSFSIKIGMPQKTVNNYLNKSRKMSLEFIVAVVSTFGLSYDWLIAGLGEIYLEQNSPPADIDSNLLLEKFDAVIRETQELRQQLEEFKSKMGTTTETKL